MNFSAGHLLRYHRNIDRALTSIEIDSVHFDSRAGWQARMLVVPLDAYVLVLQLYPALSAPRGSAPVRVLVSDPRRGLICGLVENSSLRNHFVRIK
jgi:hypothetical protein